MATYGIGRQILVYPFAAMGQAFASNTTMIMDADGEELAIKYQPQSTSPITDITMYLDVAGDTTGINFAYRVESDSADAPSATILGAATPAFNHTVDGFTTLQTLAANTGALTVNVPVWLIVARTGGSSLSGTNNIRFAGLSAYGLRCRLYTGGNWNTVSTVRGEFVVKHADGTYAGVPFTNALTNPAAATDIYGSYRHGVRLKTGSQIKIIGFLWYPIKAGSPNSLIAAVFEGSTLKYSDEIPAASIITTVWMPVWFSSPVLLAANTNLYLVIGQEDDLNDGTLGDDGGDDSNDYDNKVYPFSSTYRQAALPTDVAFVYGTGNDPTAYTVSDVEYPMLVPIIVDPATDLDEAAGGGGFPILGGSVVR